ncbi:hypothetical protein [Oceanobacter mangrovi]|uniref:hypothetical protein n=1 Tax=Oceanobacter mangrovi TaxID=2862510 RepID=UPI001C8D0A2D|nr:hypothetical protein [Oceanobacter mangrovi]
MTELLFACGLLISAALISWHNRPATKGNQWPGSAAGRFAAGLILLGTAVSELLAAMASGEAVEGGRLIMTQLGLYAALPMLVSTQLAERFGYHWTRQIWGRILLGWCVVFELARRANALDSVLLVSLLGGLLVIALAWWRPVAQALKTKELLLQRLLPGLIWLALIALLQLQPAFSPLALLFAATIALYISQPESYRIALSSR